MFPNIFKKAQTTTMEPATRLIGVILLGVVIFLLIYFAISGKLSQILVSDFI